MTRARDLSRFTNPSAVSVDSGTYNVGIGSTSPDVKLDVIGSIEASGISTFQNNLFVGAGITMLASSGIVSAVSFYGDFYGSGENLTGVASTDNILSNAITVSGVSTFSGGVGIADSIFHIGDDNTAIRFPFNDGFTIETAGSERVRVHTSGKVGINTDDFSRDYILTIADSSSAGTQAGILINDTDGREFAIRSSSNGLRFRDVTGGNDRLVLDSSGILGVNTTTTINPASFANPFIQVAADDVNKSCISVLNDQNNANQPAFIMAKRRLSNTVVSDGDVLGTVAFQGWDGDEFLNGGLISCLVDATAGNGDMPTRMAFYTTADTAQSPTERYRINRNGRLSGGQNTAPTGDSDAHLVAINGTSTSYQGNNLVNFVGSANNSSSSGTYTLRVRQNVDANGGNSAILRIDHTNPAGGTGGEMIQAWSNFSNSTAQKIWVVQSGGTQVINRPSSDGTLIDFQHAQTTEGTISVSGSTVQLNGAHLSRWSQLSGGAERIEILRGSVLSNLDEMCEWIKPDTEELLWTQEDLDMYLLNGDEGLPGGAQIGDVKEPATSGVREDNEQLNRMKVSDVEGDKNVAGVFVSWDDDDDTYTNDFYCAMTGDFIIRIAQGVTVERGDLLISAGDGTAKPQEDDIIRSKTIAKVTSTNVSCTYDDGSYCVPCVLMAC